MAPPIPAGSPYNQYFKTVPFDNDLKRRHGSYKWAFELMPKQEVLNAELCGH